MQCTSRVWVIMVIAWHCRRGNGLDSTGIFGERTVSGGKIVSVSDSGKLKNSRRVADFSLAYYWHGISKIFFNSA
ncbi:hypothetical protein FACS1894219_01940 [Clostridia bacterium]|nr:hypothetical protein FACS1894219_01940 [Clostridia bacterium]